jgi:hypothetical protein
MTVLPPRLAMMTAFSSSKTTRQTASAGWHKSRTCAPVELQAGNAVVVRRQAVYGVVLRQRPDPDGAVGAARDERVAAHLQLADERRVALQDREACSIVVSWFLKSNIITHPKLGSHIRTVVSKLPVAIFLPSKAIA